jgi:hypothetical protein
MHTNNLPTWPGAIIGYRKNGTPIRLIAGGAPDGDGDGAGDGQGDGAGTGDNGHGGNDGGTGTGGQSDADTGQQQQGSADAGPSPSGEGNAMRAVREEAKQAKAAARELRAQLQALQAENTRRDQETAARNLALAKALGLATDEPPDPAQLARELEAAKAQTTAEVERAQKRERELTVELELLKQARRHGADPEMLVDSRSFMQTLGKLDPASEDFATDLGDAIKTAVEKNPGFKLTTTTTPPAGNGDGGGNGPSNASGSGGNGDGTSGDGQGGTKPKSKQGTTAPPARSGTAEGHNGAPGGNRQWTDDDVAKASPAEVVEAMNQGLLANLGIQKPKARR